MRAVFAVIGLTSLLLWAIFVRLQAAARQRAESKWGEQHGCKGPPLLDTGRWPLGVEILVGAFQLAKKQQLLYWFDKTFTQTGHTFEQRILGGIGFNTIEPRNIEAVLNSQFNDFDFGHRRATFLPLLGDGIFTQTGAAWAHSRALLRPVLAQNREQSFEQIKKSTEQLIETLPDGEVVDLQPLFFRLTLDTTAFLLFGRSTGALTRRAGAAADRGSDFAEAFDIAQDYLAQRGRLGPFYWVIDGFHFRRACRTVHSYVDGIVLDALKTKSENTEARGQTLLDSLLMETRDPKVLRGQILNVLLAGRDTTASLLSWTFRLLARHPSIHARLLSEIKGSLGVGPSARIADRNSLKKLRYLDCVLKEVLRLYPSVPINSRSALKTIILPTGGGEDRSAPVLVRKGEAVAYAPYSLHRRFDLYGWDAIFFRPERWEDHDGALAKSIGYSYVPFNAGPRVCLGQEFALLEASYVVVRMLQTFPGLKLANDEPNEQLGRERQKLTLVLSSADGCRVILNKEVESE